MDAIQIEMVRETKKHQGAEIMIFIFLSLLVKSCTHSACKRAHNYLNPLKESHTIQELVDGRPEAL